MLEIIRLEQDMKQALAEFFYDVAEGEYAKYYHPFSLTEDTAKELCNTSGKDLYYILVDNKKVIGQGMLRGWDEGYEIPSLGIVIHPDFAGKGLGSMFVRFLHSCAWARGCSKVRLGVHKENTHAIKMYKKLGYTFTTKDENELVGYISKEERHSNV